MATDTGSTTIESAHREATEQLDFYDAFARTLNSPACPPLTKSQRVHLRSAISQAYLAGRVSALMEFSRPKLHERHEIATRRDDYDATPYSADKRAADDAGVPLHGPL